MNRLRGMLWGAGLALILFFLYQTFFGRTIPQDEAAFSIDWRLGGYDLPRVGLNIGVIDAEKTSLLLDNFVANPGFEAGVSRSSLFIDSVEDQQDYTLARQKEFANGYPDHFWQGASFVVLQGLGAGSFGKVLDSKGEEEGAVYTLSSEEGTVFPGDTLVLTLEEHRTPPPFWHVPKTSLGRVVGDTTFVREQSPGKQSLRFSLGQPAEALAVIDQANGQEPSLHMEGKWTLSFWAKGEGNKTTLRLSLFKENTDPLYFLEETLQLDDHWREYFFQFYGKETTTEGPLFLRLEALGEEGESVWIDDLYLGQKTAPYFRQDVLQALQELAPEILRDGQAARGQLADNLLADPFATRPTRYKMALGEENYSYTWGWKPFLALCKAVQADPWLILPSLTSNQELELLAQFLQTHVQGFKRVYLEYGDETWNPLHQTGQPPYPDPSLLRGAFVMETLRNKLPSNVEFVQNAAWSHPESLQKLLKKNSRFSSVALTAFFALTLDAAPPEQQLRQLFAPYSFYLNEWSEVANEEGKQLLLAETNLLPLKGTASLKERQKLLRTPASGLSLIHHLLQAFSQGVKGACVYKFSGQTTPFQSGKLETEEGTLPLFGVIETLGPNLVLRPQGVALAALNKAIRGRYYPATAENTLAEELKDSLLLAAFQEKGALAVVVSSSSPLPQTCRLFLPSSGKKQFQRLRFPKDLLKEGGLQTLSDITTDVLHLEGDEQLMIELPPYQSQIFLPL